jgi:hypothetical protein
MSAAHDADEFVVVQERPLEPVGNLADGADGKVDLV